MTLDRSFELAGELSGILSPEERARAQRFRFAHHRRRFEACRGLLRIELSKELNIAPKNVAFTHGPYGKPAVAGRSEVSFNVSHSGEYALIAIGTCGDIGIDIEAVRPIADVERLADTVFSAIERDALARLPPSDRLEGFYSGWTRKEAYIKARGDGLNRPLADFDVTIGPREPARLTRVAGEPHETERWTLSALSPVRGYAAAVCVEGRDCSLLCNW